jgi:hypothetical protein
MDRVDSLIVLPDAGGPDVTNAELKMVLWLAHATGRAATEKIDDFSVLEKLVRKRISESKVGDKTKLWWASMTKPNVFQAGVSSSPIKEILGTFSK